MRKAHRLSATTTLGYLAPFLPSISTTFVYEELLALERRDVKVVPFAMFSSSERISGLEGLTARTTALYGNGSAAAHLFSLLRAIVALPQMAGGLPKAFRWLLADISAVGLFSVHAPKIAYQWLVGARLGLHLRRASCVHLHVHFASAPTQIAMYASAFSGIPFTVTGHANDIFERGLLLAQKASRATKFLTISDYNACYLKSRNVPPDKLAVVRCGVSFHSADKMKPPGLDGIHRIGSLGRLVEKKGMDDLLRAVALLVKSRIRVALCIGGDGPLRPSLEALAEQLGISCQVQFVGAIHHSKVSNWLATIDTFALACKTDVNGDMDGIPVVLMEAMSQRVPVVSTRLSGIPELILHEKTGLLAEPADAESLATELRRLIENQELRLSLTDAAVHHVQTEFGQAVNVERLLDHIKCGSPGSRAEAPALQS